MASNDLGIRFTEEKYATRSEVARDLKTPLVDSFWKVVKDYRSNFMRSFSLKALDGTPFSYCGSQAISGLINRSELKLVKLFSKYSKTDSKNGDTRLFQRKSEIESLKSIAKKYNLDVDGNYLRSLLDGKITSIASSHVVLANYASALRETKKLFTSSLNEDFLANIYMKLVGSEELVSFYRSKDDDNPENRIVIDRLYTSAPHNAIEGMMDNLFSFLQNSEQNDVVKALTAYYFINYVKPFEDNNDELAVLLLKAILSRSDIDELAFYIPIERLLSDEQDVIAKIFIEVQKTNDVTYFLDYGLKVLEGAIDKMLELINVLEADSLNKDYYREAKIEASTSSLFEEEKEVEEDIVIETIPEPVVVKEVIREIIREVEKPVVEQKPISKEIVEQPSPVRKDELAFSFNVPFLDEKDAARLEQHLLELDPELKRGQAHFYARHCTMGKRYTISQYKKALGCAYETARTSMDSLASLGYYRQEMVKNKKVYTPISKK